MKKNTQWRIWRTKEEKKEEEKKEEEKKSEEKNKGDVPSAWIFF